MWHNIEKQTILQTENYIIEAYIARPAQQSIFFFVPCKCFDGFPLICMCNVVLMNHIASYHLLAEGIMIFHA